MASRVLVLVALTASLSAATIATSAQQPSPPLQAAQPVFRSGIDLLTTEASVFDKDGHPVSDLQPGDFTVKVDGKPRKVLFSRFYGAPPAAAGATPAQAGPMVPPPGQASNMTAAPGRVIVMVVDQESIRPGSERAVLETAGRFVDALSPADAVGLLGMPTLSVSVTRDRARVRDALSRIVGTQPMPDYQTPMSLEKAEAIEHGDQRVLAEAIGLCRLEGDTLEVCMVRVPAQAREITLTSNNQARQSLNVLGNLVEQLKTVRGPKEIVLISGGMSFGIDTGRDYKAFAQRAAEAETVVYTIQLDQSEFDASTMGMNWSTGFSTRGQTWDGLAALANMTGGGYFAGIARATGVFNRLFTELSNFYELGIESGPADANGKTHAIEIKTMRPGITVRSRPDAIVAARDPKASADPLSDALRQPIDVSELPLAVATYASRAAGDDPKKMKILVSAEIGGGVTLRNPVEWAFVVLSNDKKVADGRHQETPAPGANVDANAYVTLDAGPYRLRFAATDGSGRAGSLEIPLNVVSTPSTGDLQTSDLMVGGMIGGHFRPRARVARTANVVAIVELYAADPATFERIEVALQLTAEGATEPVGAEPMELQDGVTAAVRVAQASLNLESLAPGRYTASAVVTVNGRALPSISRVIDIVR